MYILKITTENEMSLVEYDPPHYKILNDAVGGWYENVHPMRLEKPYFMMVNEEGYLHDLPLNLLGSILYGSDEHGYPILGDIVIVKEGYYNDGPDAVGMDEDEAKSLGEQFITRSCGKVRWAE